MRPIGRMLEESQRLPPLLLVVSVLIVLAMFVKAGARRYFHVPPVVGYLLVGLALRAVDGKVGVLSESGQGVLEFMSELGVAALLFHVGLKSNLGELLGELPRAVPVWILDVVGSTSLGFVFARWIFGFQLIPSLFVGAALSATSVGVSVMVWDEAKRLRTRLGQLLVDVAELDDLSAIFLLLLVIAAAPALRKSAGAAELLGAMGGAVFTLVLKLIAFGLGCLLFARYVEERFTKWIFRSEQAPDRILSIVGVGFAIAALAGAIGFSVAVGALFAGLMFSRDPRAVHEEASFGPIYALFAPFFFIEVGYGLELDGLMSSLGLGLGLLVPAVLGKLLGAGLPVARRLGWSSGLLLGVSMIPRAEIALLVAHIGRDLGDWAVSAELYGALVCVAGVSSIVSPLVLEALFSRFPETPPPEA